MLKKKSFWLVIFLLLIFIIASITASRSTPATTIARMSTPTTIAANSSILVTGATSRSAPETIEKDVGSVVVQIILEDSLNTAPARRDLPPDGSIYIQYSSRIFPETDIPINNLASVPYLFAWIYDGTELRQAEEWEVHEALDQRVFVYKLAVDSFSENEALVNVITTYASRLGGDGEYWTLRYDNDKWIVEDIDLYMNWDAIEIDP